MVRLITARWVIGMVVAAWLLVNGSLLRWSIVSTAFGDACEIDALNNTSDCATSQNIVCATWCNDPCSNQNGKKYTGNAHGTLITGSKEQDPAFEDSWVKCWDDFPCQLVTKLQHLCRTSPTGSKYCDPNHPLNNCQYCGTGTWTPTDVYDLKVRACTEE